MTKALLTATLVLAGAVIVPASLVGVADGLALLFYVLSVGAALLFLLILQLGRLLPKTRLQPRSRRRARRRGARKETASVAQFERIRHAVEAAGWNGSEVHETLRPIVREIIAAKLARRHGIDLEHSPAQAQVILGAGYAWDLARPNREPPPDASTRGWSSDEIGKLIDELEAL